MDYRVLSRLDRRSLDLGRIGQISSDWPAAEEAEFPVTAGREDNCRSETGEETGRTGAELGGETGWTVAEQVGGSDRTGANVERSGTSGGSVAPGDLRSGGPAGFGAQWSSSPAGFGTCGAATVVRTPEVEGN